MYTPVPAFLTGDTIDEPFLNTYWRDNMAAGLPDMFSAKGQLAVGLGVDDMGILNVGADGKILSADSAEATGLKWVVKPTSFIPISPIGVNGPSLVGTTTRSAITDFGIPSGSAAIFIGLIGLWADVSGNPLAYVAKTGVANPAVRIYGAVNSKKVYSAGIVELDSDNYSVKILVANLFAAMELYCYGYVSL